MLKKLRFKRVWFTLGAGLLLIVVAGSLLPVPKVDLHISDKLIHVILYFILMAWFAQIINLRYHFFLALAFVCLGFLLEIGQQATGYRSFEWGDVLANSTGVLLGWIAMRTILGRTVSMIDDRLARILGRGE